MDGTLFMEATVFDACSLESAMPTAIGLLLLSALPARKVRSWRGHEWQSNYPEYWYDPCTWGIANQLVQVNHSRTYQGHDALDPAPTTMGCFQRDIPGGMEGGLKGGKVGVDQAE